MPIALEKTFWADTELVFLGFLIDIINRIICIPAQKLEKGKNMIDFILKKRFLKSCKQKVTIKQLQEICEFLNFLGRAIVPGRAFTRRLYSKLTGYNLNPYHHIRISNEMFEDLSMWSKFLCHQTAYCQPFMDVSKVIEAEEVGFFMDASRNFSLGFGGICQMHWMQGKWNKDLAILEPSIQYLELYAQTAGILAWSDSFANK